MDEKLDIDQYIRETLAHKELVNKFMFRVIAELNQRMFYHDISKLTNPEREIFQTYTPKLSKCEYNSEEYKQNLKEMRVALDHHYAENSHHPESHTNGIKEMNLVDIIEMLCDWAAAVLRNKNGDIDKSIEINQGRFNYTDELKQILKNTVDDVLGYNGDSI